MKYLRQFSIILIVAFIAEILRFLIPLPVPASVYGLVLMLAALHFRVFRLDDVREAGAFLLDIMPVLFIPAAAGLLVSYAFFRPVFIPVLIIVVLTTVAVMAVTGRVTQAVIRLDKRDKP